MKTRKVNRYYCEFCAKSGCQAGIIRKHEAHCTLNPQRACRMCGMFDRQPRLMGELLSLLPKRPAMPEPGLDDPTWDCWQDWLRDVEACLPAVRDATENCPACILATLRQAGVPVPAITSFDFTKECAAAWTDFNTARVQDAYYG